jgi:hypothetical protein
MLRIVFSLAHKIYIYIYFCRDTGQSSAKIYRIKSCNMKLLKICNILYPMDCFDILMLETQLNDMISDFLPHKKPFTFIIKINRLLHCCEIICVVLNESDDIPLADCGTFQCHSG